MIAGLLAAFALAGASAAATDGQPDDGGAILARVDGQPVYRAEVDAAVRRLGVNPQAADLLTRVRAEVLEQLIDERLLQAEVQRAQITVSDKDIDKAFEDARIQLAARGGSIEQFLVRTGRSEREFRERLRFDLGIKRLLLPKLTTAALEAMFARHHRDLDGTLVRVSHIILRPPAVAGGDGLASVVARADRIRRDILRGSLSFAEAAKRYSAGPSRHRGGDLGGFPRHGAMQEEFAKQAFALAKGEISRPFVTPFGVHLVTVTDVSPGNADLAVVRPLVEQLLAQDLLRGMVLAARQRTAIEYEPGVAHFDPATLTEDPANRRIVVEAAPSPVAPSPEK